MISNFLKFLHNIKINFAICAQYALIYQKLYLNIPYNYINIVIDTDSSTQMSKEILYKHIAKQDFDNKEKIIILDNFKPVILTQSHIRQQTTHIVNGICVQKPIFAIKESLNIDTYNFFINNLNVNNIDIYILHLLTCFNPKDINIIKILKGINKTNNLINKIKRLINYYSDKNLIFIKKQIYPSFSHKILNRINFKTINNKIIIPEKEKFDFVINKHNILKIGYNHSYLNNYKSFLFGAGTIRNTGTEIIIDRHSGHYQPTYQEAQYVKKYFNQFANNIIYENL
jgi:hypothetical protein